MANISITGLGFAMVASEDDPVPDGVIISIGVSLVGNGYGADLGFDVIYHVKSGRLYVFANGALTLSLLGLFNKFRNKSSTSVTAGLIYNMNNINEWAGGGLTATWPRSVIHLGLKLCLEEIKCGGPYLSSLNVLKTRDGMILYFKFLSQRRAL